MKLRSNYFVGDQHAILIFWYVTEFVSYCCSSQALPFVCNFYIIKVIFIYQKSCLVTSYMGRGTDAKDCGSMAELEFYRREHHIRMRDIICINVACEIKHLKCAFNNN